MSVRIKDIAERVNRSITTVSRALNGYDDVSPETKQLILETAKEMGYSPNTFAQRLQKQQSDTIGLILPTFSPRFSDPYFSELLAGIGNKAADLGFDLLVSTRSPGPEENETYEKLIDGRRVDGFIVVRTRKQDQRIIAIAFPMWMKTAISACSSLRNTSRVCNMRRSPASCRPATWPSRKSVWRACRTDWRSSI